MSSSTIRTMARIPLGVLVGTFQASLLLAVALSPGAGIAYLMAFIDPAERFTAHLTHEILIFFATLSAGFVTFVAYRNYQKSGEPFLRFVTLGFLAFTIIYAPHGMLTRASGHNLLVFLIFGPASRLVMAIYLLTGILQFRRPPDPLRIRSLAVRWWPHVALFLLLCVVLYALATLPIGLRTIHLQVIEIHAVIVLLLCLLAMMVMRLRNILLRFQMFALVVFIQASLAFLAARPWNHLWWFAHLVFATGFMTLGYALMRAFWTTGSFAVVFSEAELQEQLKARSHELERTNAQLNETAHAEKQAQQALAEQAQELTRSNKELEQFAYIAAHDLQEPLRKVQAFGDLLEGRFGESLGEEGCGYLTRMRQAAQRMQGLISDLLNYSRVTSQAKPFLPVNLAQIALEVVSDLEARIQSTRGRVDLGELPTVEGDASQIRQLLQNLIGNALKFHRSDVAPVVDVRGRIVHAPGISDPEHLLSGPRCEITVKDNGIGFDEKYLDRIFSPFQRLHGRGEYEGTGIGLAICRKIVERHRGTITAHSAPGQGSQFIIDLPLHHPKGHVDHAETR